MRHCCLTSALDIQIVNRDKHMHSILIGLKKFLIEKCCGIKITHQNAIQVTIFLFFDTYGDIRQSPVFLLVRVISGQLSNFARSTPLFAVAE